MRDPTLEEIAAVLDKAKIRNGVLRAACPAHGGEGPNLSVRYEEGKLLARCHSHHCRFEDIVAAIRERLGEEKGGGAVLRIGKKKTAARTAERGTETKSGTKPVARRGSKERRTWELRDTSGKLIALHVREDFVNKKGEKDKDVYWRRPSGEWGLGGLSTADLPLYGCEDAARVPAGGWVVVTEGEKAADAIRASHGLREAGIVGVGTVTGAGGTPGPEALSVLRGKRVVLWPDNDEAGREHMEAIAGALEAASLAEEVRVFDWEGAPEKGDAADHPYPDTLAATLKLAPRYSTPPPIPGRALIGQAIALGVDPPDELLPDMLLTGKAHNIYAPGGVGKTWLLVWIAAELVRRKRRVVVFDLENGLRTYAERFEEIGVDPDTIDDYLFYYPFPAFDRAAYEKMLDQDNPDIVMFDSWIGFLAADGRDENVSNDISAWADAFSKPALRRGAALLVLDHVPHEHERERGSSRKRDEMDVVWKLGSLGEFDRDHKTTLFLSRQKDREGWLPEKLTFEIGGDPEEGFILRRDDSLAVRAAEHHMNFKERSALEVLESFDDGATTAEWLAKLKRQDVGINHKQSLHKVRRSLVAKGKVEELNGRYISVDTQHIGGVSSVSKVYPGTPDTPQEHEAPGGVSGVYPPTGGNTRLDTPPYGKSRESEGVHGKSPDTPPDHNNDEEGITWY